MANINTAWDTATNKEIIRLYTDALKQSMVANKEKTIQSLFASVSKPMWEGTAHEEAFYDAVKWYLENR